MSEFYADPMTTLYHGDCVEVMRELPDNSVDAVVTDPPYGLEFMGKEWDRLDWRDGGGFSKPGIGKRATAWTSFGGETANPTCSSCGGRLRGSRKCGCENPDWKVRGEPMTNRAAERSRVMQEWHHRWAAEAFRVAKPGAHLLAFGGTRTVHRLAAAIEDAGLEIRDTLVWGYASGFPKSLDVSKAIDKAAGAEREVVGSKLGQPGYSLAPGKEPSIYQGGFGPGGDGEQETAITAPATDDAKRWHGWGTALKPAWEPIVMARKPLTGTVAGNVLRWGTGAINVDGTRIGTAVETWPSSRSYAPGQMQPGGNGETEPTGPMPAGRWPANIVLTDPIFDGGIAGVVGGGEVKSSPFPPHNGEPQVTPFSAGTHPGYGDAGTYSRFFLVPKADRGERERGLNGKLIERDVTERNQYANLPDQRMDHQQNRTARANHHPTVKPIELMRHLVRLVTPPGGLILDPFVGSGTTALAASEEGFRCIGVDAEAEYLEIAVGRLGPTAIGMGL